MLHRLLMRSLRALFAFHINGELASRLLKCESSGVGEVSSVKQLTKLIKRLVTNME